MPECKKSSTLFDSGISLVSHQQPHPRTLLFFFSLPQWKEEEGEEKSHWSLTHFCLIPNSSNFTSAYIMSTILQKFYFCVATQVTWFSVPFVPFQRIIIEVTQILQLKPVLSGLQAKPRNFTCEKSVVDAQVETQRVGSSNQDKRQVPSFFWRHHLLHSVEGTTLCWTLNTTILLFTSMWKFI